MSSRNTHCRLLMVALLAGAGLGLPMASAQETKPADQPGLKQLSPEEVAKMKEEMAAKQVPPAMPGQGLPNALQIDNPSFDWGDISDAEPVSHTFEFSNISDKTVKITVAASCGCTVAGLEKDTYAPGEKGKITATFNPAGRNGSQTKQLTMTVIDPQGVFAQQLMTVTSNVKALVQVDPPKMYLSEVDHKAGQTSKITITARSADFKITGIESNSEFVRTTLGEPTVVEENGEKLTKYTVDLAVGKGAPIGNLSGQLSFMTNNEKIKVPAYFIGADVTGDVKATPPQAMLRVTNVNTPFETQVRVDSRSGSTFGIRSIEIEGRQDMRLVADAVKSDEGTYYMITLSGVTPDQPGIVNGTMIITTDADGGEMIRVPFTAAVRKADATPAAVKPISPSTAAMPGVPTMIKK